MADTIEQILARAKQSLRRTEPLIEGIRADERMAGERAAERRAVDSLRDPSDIRNVVGETASALSLPLAFASGPMGAIAGGAMALEGIANAARPDATGGERLLAGAGVALPFMGRARRLLSLGKKVDDVGAVLSDSNRAAQFEDVADRVRSGRSTGGGGSPQRTQPYRLETPFNPAEPHMPNASNPRAGQASHQDRAFTMSPAVNPVDRYAPNLPAEFVPMGGEAAWNAAGQADDSIRALDDVVDRFMPNIPAAARPNTAVAASGIYDGLLGKIGGQAPAPGMTPATRTGTGWRNTESELLNGVDSAPMGFLDRQHASLVARAKQPKQPAPASMRALFNKQEPELLDDVVESQMAPSASDVDDLIGGMANPRPSQRYVHPVDRSGAEFDFDEVPEISEAELTRLQNLFKRVTGR